MKNLWGKYSYELGITYKEERLPFSLKTRDYLAKSLIEKGYQKVDRNKQVVLSREDYDSLKAENDKYVKDCINYLATINKLENKVWEVEQQARKETAREILQELYIACEDDTYGQVVVDFTILENFARQYGVDIGGGNNDADKTDGYK